MQKATISGTTDRAFGFTPTGGNFKHQRGMASQAISLSNSKEFYSYFKDAFESVMKDLPSDEFMDFQDVNNKIAERVICSHLFGGGFRHKKLMFENFTG
jgi:hypothetical protein